ncbi:TCTEX1 domain-containing protein 1-b [Plakobranchus ocellatus]|uniref:TCTEX1 domain-containing protein 1-b n=1 Tax=Plakobranchus ocellatus TaxID=259542 RepID=A0AAV3YPA4_9GAST|nr:TCTEX1 domain-containing protein 1-b [Plakobranchus ocellatus]
MTTEPLTTRALEEHDRWQKGPRTGISRSTSKQSLMASELLTRRALEEHDKSHSTSQSGGVARTRSQSRDERANAISRSRKISRVESSRSLSLSQLNQESSSKGQLERKPTRSSLYTPSSTMRAGGMTVFRVVAAAKAWKRLSERRPAILASLKPKVAVENTYKLGPDEGKVFKPEKVKSIIENVLNSFLKSFRYTQEGSKRMCLAISRDVKSRVKMLDFQRYKLVCNVIIMQNKGQGSQMSSRCLSNTDFDTFASASLTTSQIICVTTVHAFYFD